jgi:hypothetical protein
MNRRTLALCASGLLCCLGLAGAALAALDAHNIARRVIAGGGGRLANAALSLEGTIGQPVVGMAIEMPHVLSSGFWFEPWAGEYRGYLPLAVREY